MYHSTRSELPRFKGQRNPFTGLVSSRISCLKCGYRSPLRHESFDNLSLALNDNVQSCELIDLVKSYTTPEIIHDYICDKCSLLATKSKLIAKSDIEKQTVIFKKKIDFLNYVYSTHSYDIDYVIIIII
jgi:ubiquitin C-terminal hydrolase